MKLVKDTLESPNWFVAIKWEKGLEHFGLLSLLFMPYFGWSTEVNNYVKQLLVIFHGGFLWLDKPYSISANLMLAITRLPRAGADPLSVLVKENDPSHIAKFKDKYDLVKSGRGFSISSINDPTICTTTTILSYKMFHTSWPHQYTAGAIMLAALYA